MNSHAGLGITGLGAFAVDVNTILHIADLFARIGTLITNFGTVGLL